MGITVTISRDGRDIELEVEPGALISDILQAEGGAPDMPCGGKGKCLRCGVRADGGLSPPGKAEIRAFGEKGLADGWRLACRARVLSGATIYPDESRVFENILVSGALPDFNRDPVYKNYGAAVDVGTTTISAQLYGKKGFCRAASMKNPQTAYGADVITRIEKSMAGFSLELSKSVSEAISQILSSLAREESIKTNEIDAIVITGNTAMLYLLTGQNPQALSRSPFEADTLFGELRVLPGLSPKAYFPRCISAFVGADITTAILACGMCGRRHVAASETSLLMDIGTNGEAALWHDGKLLCCSTAAGPAFEGAGIHMGLYGVNGAVDKVWLENDGIRFSTIGGFKPVGICGSGIVDAISVMLNAGIIDETGSLQKEGHRFIDSVTEINSAPAFMLGDGIVITARDIRNVQLAKGSVRAGVETLLRSAGIGYDEVANLYIAGGFGGYLNLESAANIGLIPAELVAKARISGNAAQSGAAMILENRAFIEESNILAGLAETVALSANPVFTGLYMQHMMFE